MVHSHLQRGAAVLALAGAMSCSTSHSGDVAACVPGASVGCVGPGSCAGYQVCARDGTYGACVCGEDGGTSLDAAIPQDGPRATPDATTDAAGEAMVDAPVDDSTTDAASAADGSPDCGPPVPATPTTLAMGGPTSLAVDNTGIYWSDSAGTILTLPLDGGVAMTLAAGQQSPAHVHTDGTNVYWGTAANQGSVLAVSRAGGSTATLASGAPVQAISVGAGTVYVATDTSGTNPFCYQVLHDVCSTVTALPVDGGSSTELGVTARTSVNPDSLASDTRYVSFGAGGGTGYVGTFAFDGGTGPSSPPQNRPFGLIETPTQYFWFDNQVGLCEITSAPLDLSTATTLVAGGLDATTSIGGLAADDTYLYWTSSPGSGPAAGLVLRMPLGGGCITTLASGSESFGAIAVDASFVYWTSTTTVQRLPK